MLGKRPRPILRTTSKSQLMPKSPSDSPPPARSEEFKVVPSPAPAPPRLVIGFNLVSQKSDRKESPRSVMEPKALAGIAKVASLEKSPRSPRSGLECLLSGPLAGGVKGNEEVVLAPAGTNHTKEGDAEKGGRSKVAEKPAFLETVIPVKCCSGRSPTASQPIPITSTHFQSVSREKAQLGKATFSDQHEAQHEACVRQREEPRNQGRGDCVVWDDEDVVKRESIFSTVSPASSCNENVGDFGLTDFLSACFFCKRHLAPGKDIFMYRGDRAFCTAECRYNQIVVDERKERCAAATHKTGVTVPSNNSNFRSKVMAATTAAAA